MAVVDEHAAKNQNQRPLYITVSSALDDLGAPFLTGRTPFWRRGGASFFGPRPLGVFLTATSLCRMYIHVRPHKDRLGNEPMVRPVQRPAGLTQRPRRWRPTSMFKGSDSAQMLRSGSAVSPPPLRPRFIRPYGQSRRLRLPDNAPTATTRRAKAPLLSPG